MKRQNVRVVLASEHSSVRYFLKEIVEGEAGAVIVGQAENAGKALTLARNLRPDIAIIDCYLPHTVGLDTVALSRVAGLDTAQTISEEIPNTRVILLPNLAEEVLPGPGLEPDNIIFFSRKTNGSNTSFTLQELCHETLSARMVVFANVEARQQDALRQKVANMSDKAVLFGGLAILGGVFLVLTLILAGAGIALALAGVAAVLLGLVGKLTASLWPLKRQSVSRGKAE